MSNVRTTPRIVTQDAFRELCQKLNLSSVHWGVGFAVAHQADQYSVHFPKYGIANELYIVLDPTHCYGPDEEQIPEEEVPRPLRNLWDPEYFIPINAELARKIIDAVEWANRDSLPQRIFIEEDGHDAFDLEDACEIWAELDLPADVKEFIEQTILWKYGALHIYRDYEQQQRIEWEATRKEAMRENLQSD